jgi:endonuclease YncB( thermonuclease family)
MYPSLTFAIEPMMPLRAKSHFAVCAVLLAMLLAAPIRAWAECTGEDGGGGVVAEISDGDTLILDDGRAVRLVGMLGPKRARGGPVSEARADMENAVRDLTLGKKVTLQLDERKRDRYGRLLAQVKVIGDDAPPVWVQGKIIGAGLARVISSPDNRLCITELLALENQARKAQAGLWRSGFFTIRHAEAEDLLTGLAEAYEIVEGQVSNVTEIRGKTYINFGQNWRRDFTAFVSAESTKRFGASEADGGTPPIALADLGGRRIRVRGWMKNFNGPSITVTHPEQIEILDRTEASH